MTLRQKWNNGKAIIMRVSLIIVIAFSGEIPRKTSHGGIIISRVPKKKPSQQRFLKHVWSEVTQLCPTLCDPMDCSLSGSSVHGIFQTRVLEWIAISCSRGSLRPRNQKPRSPTLQADALPSEPPGKPSYIELNIIYWTFSEGLFIK